MMFLRDYEYVIELARTGSILKASQNLCISSSALSKYIRNIEDELGMPLFQRGGKVFTLTYAGERYLVQAKEILRQNEELEKEMCSIRDQQSGWIRMGFPRMSVPLVLNTILPQFRSLHPQVSLMLHEDITTTLMQLLMNNELDMIISQFKMDEAHFQHILLSQDELVLVVNHNHPLNQTAVRKTGFRYPWVDLSQLAQEEFVLCHPRHAGTQLIQNLFRQYQMNPPVAFYTQGAESCLMAVAQGLGVTVAILSPLIIHEFGIEDKVSLLSFGKSPQLFDRMLIQRRKDRLSGAERDLIRLFQISAS